MISTLLNSKRTWVIIITMALHLLSKYHVVLSDTQVSDLADQLILVAGGIGVIATKILDSRKPAAVA